MKGKNLESTDFESTLLYHLYLLYIYNILVDMCNIALILFLKYDITKFRIPPFPLSHFVDSLCAP